MAKAVKDTREQLLDAAQELIQRRGVNAMSFQDLSDAVGIRKASVHHHFSSKAEMVSALMQRYLTVFAGVVRGILESRVNGKSKLRRYCNVFVETLKAGEQDKGCLCGMLMAEMLSLDKDAMDLIHQFLKDNLDCVESIITEGIQDGSLSRQSSIKGAAQLVLATMEGGLLVARCGGGPKQLADIAGRLVACLSAG